jgi:hypothetical protein
LFVAIELNGRSDVICILNYEKEMLRLRLMQAEQFNEAIQIVRNWLPDAEAELKFHSIPDDEDSIMQQIENHEVR